MGKDYIKTEINKFLKNENARLLTIKYDMKKLNSAKQWYRLRNPLRMLWTSFIVEICRKLPPCEFKNNLYRMIGVKIGKDVTISPDVVIDWLFPELITIEDGVLIGADMFLVTHEFIIDRIRLGRMRIGNQAMLATWVVNDPGVNIGERSIVGMLSYLREDVPPYAFVAGIPAKVIKMLDKETYLAEKDHTKNMVETAMYDAQKKENN